MRGKHLLESLAQADFQAPTLIHSALIWPWLWGLFPFVCFTARNKKKVSPFQFCEQVLWGLGLFSAHVLASATSCSQARLPSKNSQISPLEPHTPACNPLRFHGFPDALLLTSLSSCYTPCLLLILTDLGPWSLADSFWHSHGRLQGKQLPAPSWAKLCVLVRVRKRCP